MKLFIKISVLLFLFHSTRINAQIKHSVPLPVVIGDTLSVKKDTSDNHRKQIDLIDIGRLIVNKHAIPRVDTVGAKSMKLHVSAIPAAGYTLQTGFAALAVANAGFYTNKHAASKISSVLMSITYSQRKQIILPIQTNIWTEGNKYNIVTDWRYLKYPSFTYGLGGFTPNSNQYTIDYSAIRLHQTIYRNIAEDMYAGVGYNFDYYWNIKEVDPPSGEITDFEKYGLSGSEQASGITFNLLYDSRKNSINAEGGSYANVVYRTNLMLFGNDATWRSLVFDLRKYIQLPFNSNNILAIWNYDWLTVSGNPPYLLLPNTGGDPYSNTGRGYIQGRFRGKNMLYLETEYRLQITRNGLLGAVVFVNAQSYSEETNNRFETILPGYGGGLRIKLNKFSRTNIALDYGLGKNSTGGFFVNLGEVF